MIQRECAHSKDLTPVTAKSEGSEECLKLGDIWVQLRLCLVCGNVGCCNSSKNKHAMKHFLGTGHAVIESFKTGEDVWRYCWVDDVYFEV